MKRAETVTLGAGGLNRAAEFRGDPEKQTLMLDAPEARFTPVWRSKTLIDTSQGALVWLEKAHTVFANQTAEPVFLGLNGKKPLFAVDISAWSDPNADPDAGVSFVDVIENQHPDLPQGQVFRDLRSDLTLLSRWDAEVAAASRAVFTWHRSHKFCATCGQKSVMSNAGWQRDCPSCARSHFPRTDPVVIMLITLGNKVLVGRSHGWPDKMYSLLAGFVEPGESVENAVRREAMEEAGIEVGSVVYLTSQTWPFPASLMIGCQGEAINENITVDPAELDDALWIEREDLAACFWQDDPQILPARKGSIAHFLIHNWLGDTLN